MKGSDGAQGFCWSQQASWRAGLQRLAPVLLCDCHLSLKVCPRSGCERRVGSSPTRCGQTLTGSLNSKLEREVMRLSSELSV